MRRGRPPYPDVLTPREQEVLALVREGLTNEQIGARLGISEHGAKYHVAEILSKLGVPSRQEAARWSQPQRVAPGLLGLLTRHAAVGALVAAGIALVALAAGVLLMNERSGGSTTGSGQQSQQEESLPPPPGVDNGPIRRIAYVEVQGDEADIWTMNPDGSDKVQLTNNPGWEGHPVWSPDGRRIAFVSRGPGTGEPFALSVMNSDGSNVQRILENSGQTVVQWSPDGKKLAFTSTRIGSPNVFVIDVDGSNLRTLTSSTAGNSLHGWSQDSKTVLYDNGAGINAIGTDGSDPRVILPLRKDDGDTGELAPDLQTALVAVRLNLQFGPEQLEQRSLVDGSTRVLSQGHSDIGGFAWSPDKSRAVFHETDVLTDSISLVMLEGSDFSTQSVLIEKPYYPPTFWGTLAWSSDQTSVIYSVSTPISRSSRQTQFCYVNVYSKADTCLAPIFVNTEDGPTSPSPLLN